MESFPFYGVSSFPHNFSERRDIFWFSDLEEDFDDEIIANSRKYIRIYFNNCHEKLDYYYILIDKISACAAIMIFNFIKH
jgi:hypothetical protein